MPRSAREKRRAEPQKRSAVSLTFHFSRLRTMTSAANAKQPSEELDKDVWKKVEQQFTAYGWGPIAFPGEVTNWGLSRKRSSEFFDPCQDFADASIKCMRRNNSDKEMCQDYFKYDPLLKSDTCTQKLQVGALRQPLPQTPLLQFRNDIG
jgi:hypothetical protein